MDPLIARARGVIFDFDGTLFDLQVDWPGLRSRLQDEFPSANFQSIRQGIDQVEAELGASELERAFGIILQFEMQKPASPRRKELDWLRQSAHRGAKIGVFSANQRGTILRAWEGTNIASLVDPLIAGDNAKRRKPDPWGLHEVLSSWDFSPTECVYVADGPLEAQTAHEVGIPFVKIS